MANKGGVAFAGSHKACTWTGHVLTADEISEMVDDIRERALDLSHSQAVADQLRDLASTGLASEWIEDFLTRAEPAEVLDWQVGEAIAEAILQGSFGVVFPWNSRRDERISKASLPGADLVGISTSPTGAVLVFGEVKSSRDHDRPPGVLVGKSGLIQQLERLLEKPQVQLALVQWLAARVPDGPVGEQFNEALRSFVNSQGASIRLIGALLRDTEADEADVSARGTKLGDLATPPGTVELLVWYLPIPMGDWPGVIAA